nr:hypothetical protein CFP56_24604 [Quercus suber]
MRQALCALTSPHFTSPPFALLERAGASLSFLGTVGVCQLSHVAFLTQRLRDRADRTRLIETNHDLAT